MTVTFEVKPGLHVRPGYDRSGQPQNATELFQQCSPEEFANHDKIIQSSFSDADLSNQAVEASHNGFVWAAIHAYNEHHHLVIRPDDLWLAILTHFNLFLNARQQGDRQHFIAKNGPLELEIVHNGPLRTYNWTNFPQDTVSKFGKLVNDPNSEQWILPSFSTTEASDKVVCAAAIMNTLQHQSEYGRYGLRGNGGIPAVTLLGEKSDWEEIQSRIRVLGDFDNEGEFDHEVVDWCELLRTVVDWFVSAYQDPKYARYNAEHWAKMVYNPESMARVNYLDGWITAFCFWDERGRRLHGRPGYQGLKWDEFDCSRIKFHEIPPGFAAVPVKIDENGQVHRARMIAGSMATRGHADHTDSTENAVHSKNVWCLFETKG